MKSFIACLLFALVASAMARRGRIVGGADVPTPGKWPWQGSLQFTSGSHTCGCVVLSNTWILTAAHCVSRAPSSYRVGLGLHDRTTQNQGNPAFYPVESLTRHPGWTNSGAQGFPNDIAVIKLAEPAELNEFVAAASLAPSDASDFVGNECYISGWGRLRGFGPLPNVLQEANVDIYTEAECRGFWGSRIQGYHICLGDKETQRRGACNGDSGGPLSCKVGDSFQVAGVTSWGRSGCSTASPSVYARVSYFRDWINEQTGI